MHTEQVQGGVVLLEAMGLGVVLLIGCEWTGLGAWTLLGRSKQERSIYENTRLRGDLERCALHPRTISCCEEWLWQGSLYHDAKGKGGMKSDSIGFDLRFTAKRCSLDCPEIWWYNHDRSGRKLETR